MQEVCFLIGRGGAILHADASNNPAALPDARSRWEAIWEHREELEIIAHSHPTGPAAFSAEDESTMEAIDGALGRPVRYCVVAPRVTIARTGDAATETISPEPWWAHLMRLASGMHERTGLDRSGKR
jgi:hypothetical protein